jgi:tetratricopeptide (TPR) repeat protein
MSRIPKLMALLESSPADADVMYMLAQEHAGAGDDDAAMGWYDRCLAADPGYLYAYFHKAEAMQRTGDTPGAAACAKAGLDRAKAAGDGKAVSELAALLDELA